MQMLPVTNEFPKGRLAVVGQSGEIKIYDLNHPDKEPTSLVPYGDFVYSMQMLPVTNEFPKGRLAVAGDGGEIKIYDLNQPKETQPTTVGSYGKNVRSMQLVGDNQLAVAGEEGEIIVITLDSTCIMADKQAGTFINAASGVEHNISEIPAEAVTLLEPKSPRPWQEELKEKIDRLADETRSEQKLPQAQSISRIVNAHPDPEDWEEKATLNKPDLEQGMVFEKEWIREKIQEADGHMVSITMTLPSSKQYPNGALVVGCVDGGIKIYDMADPKAEPISLVSLGKKITAMQRLPDGSICVAIGDDHGEIYIYDLKAPINPPVYFNKINKKIYRLEVLPPSPQYPLGQLIANKSIDAMLIYDLHNPQADPMTIPFFTDHFGISEIRKLPDNRLVIAHHMNEIMIYNPAEPDSEPVPLITDGSSIYTMLVLPDERLAVGGMGGAIKIYDPAKPKESPVIMLTGSGDSIHHMNLLPDGRLAVMSRSMMGQGSQILVFDPNNPNAPPLPIDSYGRYCNFFEVLQNGTLVAISDKGEINTILLNQKCIMADKEKGTFINAATGVGHNVSEISAEAVTLLEPKGLPPPSLEMPRAEEAVKNFFNPEFRPQYKGLPFYFVLGEDDKVYLNYQGRYFETRHKPAKGLTYKSITKKPEPVYLRKGHEITAFQGKILNLSDILHPQDKEQKKTLIRKNFLMETDVLKDVELSVLKAFERGWAVDLEGGSGAGKTSISKEIALLLGIPSYVFQMHGQRNLSDWVGGYSQDAHGNIRRNNIPDEKGHFRQTLLEAITHGGVFVVDEGAVGKKGRALLNWLSVLLRDRTPGRTFTLHEFPGLEIPLTVHPDFRLIITNNLPGETQAREVVKSETASNLIFIQVSEDDGPDTLKGLYEYYLEDYGIESARLEKLALEISSFHTELKKRIGTDLGLDDTDRHYISKREIRRAAKLFQWSNEKDNDPLFNYYVSLRIVYESFFSHTWEKNEVERLIGKTIERIEPGSLPRLEEKFQTLKKSAFHPKTQEQLFTDNELEQAFIAKLSMESGEPVLFINEQGSRTHELIEKICSDMHSSLCVIDATPDHSRLETLGGLFPDFHGKPSTTDIGFILGKITQHLMTEEEYEEMKTSKTTPEPKTIWIRNIDLWSEDLRTALNGFLEDGFIEIEMGDGRLKKFIRPPHIHFIAEIASDSVQDFSSAFFNRWIKLGVPREDPPASGIYSKYDILNMLSGEQTVRQEKLLALVRENVLLPMDAKGSHYKWNPDFNPEHFPKEPSGIQQDKIHAEFLIYHHNAKKLSDFETVLVRKYGLNLEEALLLCRLYSALMQIDSAETANRWFAEQTYDLSPTIFYTLAECIQKAKLQNKKIDELNIRLGRDLDSMLFHGPPPDKKADFEELQKLTRDLISTEALRIIGSRFKKEDFEYFREILKDTLGLAEKPELKHELETTTGNIDGKIISVGGVPFYPSETAKTPLEMPEKDRISYSGTAPRLGLEVLSRAGETGKAVAFIGEPGAVKTTLTAHYAALKGMEYYKYQCHKKSRTEDWTFDIEQSIDETFHKRTKELYDWLKKGNVVIDIDEANIRPEILWILEPILRGEKRISPMFPGEEPFEIGPNVQLVFTFNPDSFSGRDAIDKRILDKMIVAWMELPEKKDRPSITETFWGVWGKIKIEIIPPAPKRPHVPPVEAPVNIKEIDYDSNLISETAQKFHAAPKLIDAEDPNNKIDVFLEGLSHYMRALANRDGARFNQDFLAMAEELDKQMGIPEGASTLKELLEYIQTQYSYIYPQKDLIKYAILEFRKKFIPFDRHIVVFMSKPGNRTTRFLHLFPNKILKKITLSHKPGWETSGEAFVIEGKGLEKGTKLGYFDGEFALVDASKNGGKDSLQTEWTAHHELGHRNDTSPGRIVPKNIELNSMLSPLMHSQGKKQYLENSLIPWLAQDPKSYYTQAAKGILNGILLRLWEMEQRDGYAPQISDAFDSADISKVTEIVRTLGDEQLEEIACYLYDHPSYLASGNKGSYKQKAGTGKGESEYAELMQGVDGEIEVEIETVEGGAAQEIQVTRNEGSDEVTHQTPQNLPEDVEKRREQDRIRDFEKSRKTAEEIENRIEASNDEYEKMGLNGQGYANAVFQRGLNSIRARKKTLTVRSRTGLEIDPYRAMLKQQDALIKRFQVWDMSPHAFMFLGDFSGSLSPFTKQMGYAVKCIGDNCRKWREAAPKHFFYDMSFYTDQPPVTVCEMGRFYSQEQWKSKCVAMGKQVGHNGNDMLKALKEKLSDFTGSHLRPEVRRAKNKTLVLFTDGQDGAISGTQQTPELKAVLEMYRKAGVEIFAIGFGEGASPVQAFKEKGQHFIRIREDRPYDVAEAVAKIMEARNRGLGYVPVGDVTDYFHIGGKDLPGQINLEELKGHFSLTPDGKPAGTEGISNETAGTRISARLDQANLQPGETRLHGTVKSFKPDTLNTGLPSAEPEPEIVTLMKEFMNGTIGDGIYLTLDESVRKLFGETRLVLLQDLLSVAGNEKGKSYAHYGEAKGSTLFIGEKLLEHLLKNDPKSLSVLIRLEMDRKAYRLEHGKDLRSTQEVIRDSKTEKSAVQNLIDSILRAELESLEINQKQPSPQTPQLRPDRIVSQGA
ncbi:MAG: AAA family ATPase [Candidatus Aureabacteria bacterium]|nr:AAA family ATPase [Candidatus Auribacterota bacterium]